MTQLGPKFYVDFKSMQVVSFKISKSTSTLGITENAAILRIFMERNQFLDTDLVNSLWSNLYINIMLCQIENELPLKFATNFM